MTPCLGNVPALGWAFKQISDKDDRRNLMVFLTPHTISTPEERRALTGDKRGYMDKEMEKSVLKSQPEELRRKAFED
jgi:general secretion pathway protein D